MKLQSIEIRNYRSIENLTFDTVPLNDSTSTYGLIGVNEAGKSSILKAMALKEGVVPVQVKDFKDSKDKSKNIEVMFQYKLDANEIAEYDAEANPHGEPDDAVLSISRKIDLTKLIVSATYSWARATPSSQALALDFALSGASGAPSQLGAEDKIFVKTALEKGILAGMHKTIFWTAEDRYLISQPINLANFAAKPEDISIPLKNCFALADITDIKSRVASLSDSTEIELLQSELGDAVTQHIKTVWPNHPITITFLITNGLIHFHVKDTGSGGKAKTADQRSDGFKQFISFLLTVSAQDRNEEIANSILLLDEPETHLHPQAQEYLLGELVKITQNDRNNIVFFATHSNYMIDKNDLSRNFKIEKRADKTTRNQFSKRISTYASVTYEVFDIPSTDYHNELFEILHSRYQDVDVNDAKREGIKYFDVEYFQKEKALKSDKPWKKAPNQITLPTYVRNCIHHPDNGDKYSVDELRRSIESLRSYL